jgi:uncharacterized protein YjbI with pentapeptide repeats
VARFLHEADLIGKVVREESGERRVIEAIIDLRTADLSSANLRTANLTYANLSSTDLRSADLSYASLINANLRNADLRGANLHSAFIIGANLSDVKLSNLVPPFSYPKGIIFEFADLSNADLSRANLSGAEGYFYMQLAQAWSLVGATMPDGTEMTEENWEEFRKRYS